MMLETNDYGLAIAAILNGNGDNSVYQGEFGRPE
jgi:hypothetical protein